jgi:hypothetical protein
MPPLLFLSYNIFSMDSCLFHSFKSRHRPCCCIVCLSIALELRRTFPNIAIVEWDGEGIEETLLLTTQASPAYSGYLPRLPHFL